MTILDVTSYLESIAGIYDEFIVKQKLDQWITMAVRCSSQAHAWSKFPLYQPIHDQIEFLKIHGTIK